MRGGATPHFSGRGGGRFRSLQARDARGRGRGRRGSGTGSFKAQRNNGNYFGAPGETLGKKTDDLEASGSWTKSPKETDDEENRQAAMLGYPLFTEGPDKLGWLINLNATTIEDKETKHSVAAVNCYFVCQDGGMFKAQVQFRPYLYLQVKPNTEAEMDAYLRRKYGVNICEVEVLEREDLDLKNHLSGLKRKLIKVTTWNQQQLGEIKRELMQVLRRNRGKNATADAYSSLNQAEAGASHRLQDALDALVDIREHDVPYHVRFAIDCDIRCGHWFTVRAKGGKISFERREDLLRWAEPRICAFDIETTKLPLQFPNSDFDQVFMISYMLDKQGYLIVNREIVSEDIESFEYTPKPEFEGPFTVWNVANEEAVLRRWFDHMREVKPAIYVTYNGDWFDWPFIETRAAKHGMDMLEEIGFQMNNKQHECLSRFAVHMDCLHWVNRDSYLPQGSRGLKAVTKAKLGYNPVEVDPEDMMQFAADQPQTMAAYSVSDAVATMYLYLTYIHPFIFSLSTIIPMSPDEVLRKGSGTLCEQLLMVQAYKANVVAPNKHSSAGEKLFRGHLLESETYIGGKVEALESGVFRSDLPTRFKCNPAAYQGLLDSLDKDLRYAVEVEGKMRVEDIVNYEEVRGEIQCLLEELRDVPAREECPLIYHLDVAAMYPNIILTNRLQPSAIVTDEDCAACDFNRPGKTCLRMMDWVWRGETFAADVKEYQSLKNQLHYEKFPPLEEGGPKRSYQDLPLEEQGKVLKDRLKKYCQKVYKKVLDKPVSEKRTAGVCMRENDFYIGTVRAFRDRRYEYKGLNKAWKGKLDAAKAEGNAVKIREAADMVVLYDSLQLAHKCILNSFYGYVMRKGARWYCMEMAGIVTHTGANIIQMAARLVEQLGMPLELDTDGIWCCLPSSFPENFKLKNKNGKELKISYPCVMLNVMVAENNTNEQYQDLVCAETREYRTSSQMSIEFEVDGPYKAMVLPASKEEGKLIKKRYAVFNEDGTLAELKGFELKRRGELKLIKIFQSEVFEQFLAGSSLEECYAAVASVANRWLDMLDTQGMDLTDEELLSYVSESSTMSKSLDEYEGRKSCAITTAKRLAQFLGDERIKDKGLNCNYIIAKRPENAPTSDRAVPVAIFSTEPSVARSFLRKWAGDPGNSRGPDQVPDVRDILDWDYYRERLSGAIQKIITIPAAMQRVKNPVPRVKHPDWLHKKVREKDDRVRQRKLETFLKPCGEASSAVPTGTDDMEDFGKPRPPRGSAHAPAARRTAGQGGRGKENTGSAGNSVPVPGGTPPVEDPGPCPDRSEDMTGWITHQKRRWREAVAARKRRKVEAEQRAEQAARGHIAPPPPARGAGDFFRQQEAVVARSHWEIIQLAPTRTPGCFKAWVMVGSHMYGVTLRVPRTFYINTPLAPDSDLITSLGGLPVKQLLPNGRQVHNLYKVVMREAEFLERSTELALQLATPDVKDVFEERLPLGFEACLRLGCVAKLVPAAMSKPLSEGFDISDFQMKTTTEYDYLAGSGPEGLGALRHVALYKSRDSARSRAVFALRVPMDNRGLIIVVSPAANTPEEVKPALADKFWREAHAKGLAAQPAPDGRGLLPPPQIQFEVVYVLTEADACRILQQTLLQLRERYRGPLVLVIEAAGGVAGLTHDMPLLEEFPCCQVPSNSAESNYPALAWQLPHSRLAVFRIAGAANWLKEQIEVARYAHVPVGNAGSDWALHAMDVQYGRCLREARHLLWAVDPSVPDIAGGDGDARRIDELLDLEQEPLEMVTPGAYRCVCVQLQVHFMVVNAVVNATVLGEMEGTALTDLAQGSGDAFKVLCLLVNNWLADASKTSNIYANNLLLNLWRWMGSPLASLGSQSLRRTVASLIRKCMVHLVADLRRLGANVVAASATSLILATNKRNMTAAVGYVDYLLEALKRRELYSGLHFAPVKFWHTLLFRDRYNYLGLKAPLDPSIQQQISQRPGSLSQGQAEGDGNVMDLSEDDLEKPELDYQWVIKDYLPGAIQDVFLATVTEFVWLPWKEAMQHVLQHASQGGSQAAKDAHMATDLQVAWLKANISSLFSRKLLRLTRDIAKQVNPHSSKEEHQFPHLAGSHLSVEELGTPALAFVRTVCEALSLDKEVEAEVAVLRRNLLRLTHTREFAEAAKFQDPCKSFVLRDVICSYCNACTDLDLCRDPALQAHSWSCPNCLNDYNMVSIEAMLLQVVRRKARAFILQDLRCVKCKQVAESAVRDRCTNCGAGLLCVQSSQDFVGGLAVFHSVATFHGFQLLAETVDWLLNCPSASLA